MCKRVVIQLTCFVRLSEPKGSCTHVKQSSTHQGPGAHARTTPPANPNASGLRGLVTCLTKWLECDSQAMNFNDAVPPERWNIFKSRPLGLGNPADA